MPRALRIRALKVPPSIILARAAQDARLGSAFSDVTFEPGPTPNPCAPMSNRARSTYASSQPTSPPRSTTAARRCACCASTCGASCTSCRTLRLAPDWQQLRGKGKTIAIPLKGNMPDTIFSTLAGRVPLDLSDGHRRKCRLSRIPISPPKDAVLSGACDAAVLP